MPPKRNYVEDKDDYVDDYDDEDYVFEADRDDEGIATKGKRGSSSNAGNSKKRAKSAGGAATLTVPARRAVPAAASSVYYNPDFDSEYTFHDYSKTLKLKPDHENRPIWITGDNLIFLEKFSPIYQQACEFLVAIAEPESRPEYIQSYRITENSLYAAIAISIDPDSIINLLQRLCKTDVPAEVIRFINDTTAPFGKAKIVLKDNRYYIESKYPEILKELLRNPVIAAARDFADPVSNTEEGFVASAGLLEDVRNLDYAQLARDMIDNDDEDEDDNNGEEEDPLAAGGNMADLLGVRRKAFQTVSFMIHQSEVQKVKRSAKNDSKYPLMEEYDFKNDRKNPLLQMDLRPTTRIRPYQERSLSKMFGNGRARSGIIVLPCGAGKSLTGVTAASTIKRSTMVLCINNASVKQWKEQFTGWTNVEESAICVFTSDEKGDLPPIHKACIVVTTYSMMCHSGQRSASGEKMLQGVREREWGLMILDEVHVAPADMFQKVIHIVNAHCKLGLTATLVREDNKIPELGFLVGPKLYEANWIDLTNQGFLAKVQCAEIWCPMTKDFYREYVKHSTGNNSRTQRLLYTLNPTKFRACEYLIKYHTAKGDKIIIFSDDVPALVLYCESLSKVQAIPYIYGGTSPQDRRDILQMFKSKGDVPCLGLSKVGDTALDIPEANVIIQVSSHFGARRQEAQRLGRILRPKPNPTGGYNAFFYTLVSTDTKEMYFSSKRQQYLVDQGYTFKVIQSLTKDADEQSTVMKTAQQEASLLARILAEANSTEWTKLDSAEDSGVKAATTGEDKEIIVDSSAEVRRGAGSMTAMSGGGGALYMEFEK